MYMYSETFKSNQLFTFRRIAIIEFSRFVFRPIMFYDFRKRLSISNVLNRCTNVWWSVALLSHDQLLVPWVQKRKNRFRIKRLVQVVPWKQPRRKTLVAYLRRSLFRSCRLHKEFGQMDATEEQNQGARVDGCHFMLREFSHGASRQVEMVITGDETKIDETSITILRTNCNRDHVMLSRWLSSDQVQAIQKCRQANGGSLPQITSEPTMWDSKSTIIDGHPRSLNVSWQHFFPHSCLDAGLRESRWCSTRDSPDLAPFDFMAFQQSRGAAW